MSKPITVESMQASDRDSSKNNGAFIKSMTNRDLDDMLKNSARDGQHKSQPQKQTTQERPNSGVADKSS